jgi:RecA/RadA recombinase
MVKETDKEKHLALLEQKERVRGSIRKDVDYRKAIKKIRVQPIDDPLSPVEKKKILTGTALDRILSVNGGIEAGSSLMLYGQPATGKTQVIESMVVEASETGLVILIDSEGTYRAHRVRQIAIERGKDPDLISKNIRVYQPLDWIEQEATIYNLPEFNSEDQLIEVNLVALDSLMKHFTEAKEFQGRENMGQRAGIIGAELGELQRYCARHNSVLAFTNQIRFKPMDTRYVAPEDAVYPPGGYVVRHFPDYNVFIRKGPRNIRYARLVDSPDLPLMEVPFILSDGGIRDIVDPGERVKAMELADKYITKFLSGQVGSQKAGKQYYKKALRLGAITTEEAKEWLTDQEISKVKSEIHDSLSEEMSIEELAMELDKEEAATAAMLLQESGRVLEDVEEDIKETT